LDQLVFFPASEMDETAAEQQKILIVEDQPANRNLLRKLMQRRGSRVLLARDGHEGLLVARRERPNLVIADVLMPRMDGYEFVRQLRSDPEIAHTKVIFYTGNYAESEVRTLAEACGVSRVMDKAAEPEEILRIVEEVLGSDHQEKPTSQWKRFNQEHLRLLTDKLSQKVYELEALNRELEERVAARTEELRAANQRLLELNRMKDEFLAIVSHDLRSPLSGIVLGVETMIAQDNRIPPEKRLELLKQIAACAAEQITFVNDLLAIARNEAERDKLDLAKLRLSELAADALRNIAFNADAKGIQVELQVAPDEPPVEGDRQRLLQLLNNLLTNAVKFTPTSGRIVVDISPQGSMVRLKVSDSGVGIPPEQLPHIFERYHRGRRTGTAGETGTGLGLVIAKQVVELHHGSITVESTPGTGTTAIVHLPAAS
jgi:signal transduction histidine kinase